MKNRTRRLIRRTLATAVIVATVSLLVAFIAIATPSGYRFATWRKLPVLDHRLLPHVSAVFAAAFGAFFGSLSAFYLGRLQQWHDKRDKRHASLIAAQYALMSQWNVLEGVRLQQLEPVRQDPNRFAKLRLYRFNATPTFVPFADLTFVLETKDPNLLQEVHIAEQSYNACVDALRLRYEELLKFYNNPRVAHHITDPRTGAGVSEAAEVDVLFLRQATDALYELVDRALPRLVDAVEKLESLIREMLPGRQALRMVPEHQPESRM